MNGFIKGKHYNRCKRFHEYLSLSLESLHFQSFLSKLENSEEALHTIRLEIDMIKDEKDIENHEFSKDIEDIPDNYYILTRHIACRTW